MENSSPNPSFSIFGIPMQKQMSRSFGKSFPQKIALPKLRPHCSATCLNTWKAGPRKKNTLSFLEEKIGRAQIRKARNIFLWCPPYLADGGAGSFVQFPLEKSSSKVYNYSTRKNTYRRKSIFFIFSADLQSVSSSCLAKKYQY